MTELNKIVHDLAFIKELLISLEKYGSSMGGWLPKKSVMKFFDYGDTQLRQLEADHLLTVSKIGNRKFYSVESLIELINKNVKK